MTARTRFLGTILRGLACTAIAAALLAGCSNGKDGAPGATGATGGTGPTGPAGPAGPVTALNISTAQTLTATITSVTGGATPTIKFKLVDELGNPLTGLPASAISFGIVQLQPPAAGSGMSTQWISYVTSVAKPASGTTPAAWGTASMVQPGLEGAATKGGAYVDNGDGTYAYTLSQSLTAYATAATANYAANPLPDGTILSIAYDGTLTHRIGLEIRGTTALPTNNAVYDYLPGTGATTGFALTRDIVANAECDACHAKLALHGGPRIDATYCVVCHNTGNTDPSSGNSLDFKVLIHKIHMGMSLPSVVAAGVTGETAPTQGVGYAIFGYRGSFNNFNKVLWPQDQRNCTTCHNTSDPATPDAINYANVPYAEACNTCHDNVNTKTGAGHSSGNLAETDAQCITCHGPNATVGTQLQVVSAHTIQQDVNAKNYQFQLVALAPVIVNSANPTGPKIPDPAVTCPAATICQIPAGDFVRATIKVVDGSGATLSLGTSNAGAPVPGSASPGLDVSNFMPASSPFGAAAPSLTVDVAFSNADFTNPVSTRTAPSASGSSHSNVMSIRFLGFSYVTASSSWTFSAASGSANSGAPPVANADGTYTQDSVIAIPAGMAGIGGNVSGSVFIEGRAVTNLTPSLPTAQYWVTPVQTAGPYAFPISSSKAVSKRMPVDIANCDKCHKALSWHTYARNNNVVLCTGCHNPESTSASSATVSGTPGPLDFKFLIHGLHSGTYKLGGHDYTSTAPALPPTSFMNRVDLQNNPVLFPWVANPALAAVGSGANCENCHVTGGNTYYPVDASQVFAVTINPGTAIGAQDDIAITPNVAACGSCHTDVAAQSHMGQNGGITAAMQAATPVLIKGANGATLPQYQGEACGVCHGAGAVADVKTMHKVASF